MFLFQQELPSREVLRASSLPLQSVLRKQKCPAVTQAKFLYCASSLLLNYSFRCRRKVCILMINSPKVPAGWLACRKMKCKRAGLAASARRLAGADFCWQLPSQPGSPWRGQKDPGDSAGPLKKTSALGRSGSLQGHQSHEGRSPLRCQALGARPPRSRACGSRKEPLHVLLLTALLLPLPCLASALLSLVLLPPTGQGHSRQS